MTASAPERPPHFALQAAGTHGLPAEALAMLLPYLVTIAVMIALSLGETRRRLGAPVALGTPYIHSER